MGILCVYKEHARNSSRNLQGLYEESFHKSMGFPGNLYRDARRTSTRGLQNSKGILGEFYQDSQSILQGLYMDSTKKSMELHREVYRDSTRII